MADDFYYYHGTTEPAAISLMTEGIDMARVQQRDRGFFGDGFYVAEDYFKVENYGPAIVRVEFDADSTEVFPAEDIIGDGLGVRTSDYPPWFGRFVDWHLANVRNAAVWEDIPDVTEEEVIRGAKDRVNPRSEDFDRMRFYPTVTEYATEQGFDVVPWGPQEVVVVNEDAPSAIHPDNNLAKSAARSEGIPFPRNRGE
jgi:hypothetical protein